MREGRGAKPLVLHAFGRRGVGQEGGHIFRQKCDYFVRTTFLFRSVVLLIVFRRMCMTAHRGGQKHTKPVQFKDTFSVGSVVLQNHWFYLHFGAQGDLQRSETICFTSTLQQMGAQKALWEAINLIAAGVFEQYRNTQTIKHYKHCWFWSILLFVNTSKVCFA